MPTEAELDKLFKDLIQAVRGLQPISIPNYTNRVHNKAKSNPAVRALFRFIPHAPDFNPQKERDSYSQYMSGRWADDVFAHLAIASAGLAAVKVQHKSASTWAQYINEGTSEDRYEEIITILLARCLEEYIDTELVSLGQETLFKLQSKPGFKEYALEKMKTDRFLNQQISEDTWNNNHFFSMCILFISDFLQDPDGTIPAHSHFQYRASYRILEAWSFNMWNDKGKDNAQKTDQIVKFLGSVASVTYAPKTNNILIRPTPAADVMKAIYKSIIDSTDQRSYREQLQASLKRLEHDKTVINAWQTYCEEMDAFFKINLRPKWQEGLDKAAPSNQSQISDFIDDAYRKENHLYNDQPQIKVIKKPKKNKDPMVFSPLARGTSILLASGEARAVENLTASDQLHGGETGNHTSETGCTATEVEVVLVGFNGETPFATLSQIFHTSTGLRAVDARAARILNPFKDIGKLSVGHIVYRRNGERYEAVEVKSIEKTEPLPQVVYTISSGSGSQFYHANGYLISRNATKTALQVAAELVRDLPRSARLSTLSGFKELSHLFRTYDRETLEERLDLELEQDHKRDPAEEASLLLGTVSLSSNLEKNRKIKSRGKRDEIPLELVERKFDLTAHHPNRLPSNYKLPCIGVVDGRIVVNEHVQLKYSSDPDERTFQWTRELPNQQLFEHGVIQIDRYGYCGNGVVYITEDGNPNQISKDNIHTFRLQAKSAAQAKDPNFVELQRYRLTVDRDIWHPDTEKKKLNNPVVLSELSFGQLKVGDGVSIASLKMSLLDDLQSTINTELKQNLEDLYRFERQTLERNQFRGTIMFHRASMIPFISDSGDEVKTFDIKFPQIGLKMNLPVLFQEFYLDFDFWEDYIYGALFEFDPDMRGMMGNRHLIRGEWIGPYYSSLRSQVSHAFAAAADSSVSILQETAQKPSSITDQLGAYKQPDLMDLITFEGYDEDAVHTSTQTYIQDMMYYHMDQDDREQFTTQARPKGLPSTLADDLPGHLKAFLKDKYAPAFLCRSIESFPKYETKFSDAERANLWYWWEGNGDKCLSQSQEYNDLNNIASIEAMKFNYWKLLEPFFNSWEGPVVWAQKLRDKLGEKRVMNNLLGETINNGSSPINKECMIMNTLAPSEDFANEWFIQVVAFAGEIGFDYPYIDEDVELANQWLHDSMHDLVLKVLQGDPSINQAVREQLLEDIKAFEEANNLDQTRTAEERAAAVVTASSVLIGEASYWFTAVGKGLSKALKGTQLYQWVGVAFDQVAEKVSSKLPATGKMKGLTSLCMVAFYVGQVAINLIGIIQNWDVLGDDQRATVILETLKIATAGAGHAIDAFKRFKEKPMGLGPDQLDLVHLNQGTYRAFGEGSPGLGKISDEINGPGGFHDTVANHVGGDGKTATKPGKDKKWNEKITDPMGDLPPGSTKAAKKFSMSETVLKGVNIALGVGVAAAMTFTLARQWDNLTDAGKVINTLSLVTEILTVLLDVVEIGISTGVLVVSSTMSAAIPIIGAVLAVVGFVLTFVSFFVKTQKSKPPPDPIDDYIKKTARPLIATFNDAPKPQLTYSISQDKVKSGQLMRIQIEGKNNTGKDVTLTNTRLTILTGDDEVCLFSAPGNIELVSDTHTSKESENHTYVTPESIVDANLPEPSKIGTSSIYYQMDLRIAGPKLEEENALQALVLKPAQTIRSIWTAKINKRGKDDDNSTSRIEIVELMNNDKSHHQFSLLRT